MTNLCIHGLPLNANGESHDCGISEASTTPARLENAVTQASAKLKAFPRGATGLTPDSVKGTTEYQSAKREYALAFKRLQDFNIRNRRAK